MNNDLVQLYEAVTREVIGLQQERDRLRLLLDKAKVALDNLANVEYYSNMAYRSNTEDIWWELSRDDNHPWVYAQRIRAELEVHDE